MAIEIVHSGHWYAEKGWELGGLMVCAPRDEDVPSVNLVGTCGRHEHEINAHTVGVSGPYNRGLGKTFIRADADRVVISLTSGFESLRVATLAHLTADQAVRLAVRLINAAKDIDPEVLDYGKA